MGIPLSHFEKNGVNWENWDQAMEAWEEREIHRGNGNLTMWYKYKHNNWDFSFVSRIYYFVYFAHFMYLPRWVCFIYCA